MAKYDLVSLQLIKNDVSNIKDIMKYFGNLQCSSIVALSMIPTLALCAYEADNFVTKTDNQLSSINSNLYSDVRLKAKIFPDFRYGKIKKAVSNIDHVQHLEFGNGVKYEFIRKRNIYDNLRVSFFNENIICNTQLSYYYNTPICFANKKLVDIASMYENGMIADWENQGKQLHEFGCEVGCYINSVDTGLNSCKMSKPHIKTYNNNINIISKDYNTNKCFKGKKLAEISKEDCLILLYVLSVINFIVYVYDKTIAYDNGIGIRMKYLAYDSCIKTIKALANKWKLSDDKNSNAFEILSNLINNSNKNVLNTQFGNTIRHYGIVDEEIKIGLSLDNKLCGLVENYFNGKPVLDYERELNIAIKDMSNTLSSIFSDFKRPI